MMKSLVAEWFESWNDDPEVMISNHGQRNSSNLKEPKKYQYKEHDHSQTLKSDEAKWSKLTRITPLGSFWEVGGGGGERYPWLWENLLQ